jgi:hypothetical protein
MASISRRTFLVGTGASVATAGMLAVAPPLEGQAAAAQSATGGKAQSVLEGSSRHSDPLVVHVPDPSKGEIRFMVGTKEVVHHDQSLVNRLVAEAR